MVRPTVSILLVLTACGGSTTESPGAHPHDGGTTRDGGPGSHVDSHTLGVPDGPTSGVDSPTGGPWSPVCPADVPSMGASCHLNDVSCEYGCGNILVCADGTWGGEVGFGTPSCDAGANPSDCPASLSQITSGAGCTVSGLGVCNYASGACACVFPGDPVPDASSSWTCYPEPGCPWPRPRIGTACATRSMFCDYAACGSAEECTGGVWQASQGGCGA